VSDNVVWHPGLVSREQRFALTGGPGATVWMTGLSGSGKSTIARALEKVLLEDGRLCYVLDGDNVRHGLNDDLGFSRADRNENVRRLGEVAKLMCDAGVVAIVPAISPYRTGRHAVRAAHEESGLGFVEVYVDTPLEVCEQRDPKGLYKLARAGEIEEFTGVSDPYEAPEAPDVHVETEKVSVAEAVGLIVEALQT
jgi:adenylylsulfate kinase